MTNRFPEIKKKVSRAVHIKKENKFKIFGDQFSAYRYHLFMIILTVLSLHGGSSFIVVDLKISPLREDKKEARNGNRVNEGRLIVIVINNAFSDGTRWKVRNNRVFEVRARDVIASNARLSMHVESPECA